MFPFIAKKIGEKNYKEFISKTKLTNNPEIELEEVGVPHLIKWNRCKLETISFGHGITTTPLQATALYTPLVILLINFLSLIVVL